MDWLDKMVLENKNRLVLTSYSVKKGRHSNSISIEFPVVQDPSIFNDGIWSRLSVWISDKRLLPNQRSFVIDNIPSILDADEIAEKLAKDLVAQGYSVLLKKFVSVVPWSYEEQVLE